MVGTWIAVESLIGFCAQIDTLGWLDVLMCQNKARK